ncbi:hypothetical protein K492DRAFT_178676 [Lichtheimia hyalospora FSU 10163]|nr:hypothetical protein K492DRAFT_178676 [Lichtheimia hyalospora FSU 10163]
MLSTAIAAASGAVVLLLLGVLTICCCHRHRHSTDATHVDSDEARQPLRARYLQRTPTYYLWNRPPPSPSPSSDTNQSQEDWNDRRSALLKKYARVTDDDEQ